MTTSEGAAVTATPAAAGKHPPALKGFALFSVLAALMLTLLLQALDQTIVSTALPRIVSVLHGLDRYTWVVTAYMLASTAVIPIAGKLSDQFGRKLLSIVGVVVFVAGSLLAGAATTMDQLILFRGIQGIGAGMGMTLVMTVIGDMFPPRERARWQGLFGAVYGISSLIGPALGGFLTEHGPLLGSLVVEETRWRWIFYINLPLGALALAALIVYLPSGLEAHSNDGAKRGSAWRRVDWTGAVLLVAATVCLLLGLNWGGQQTYDWGSVEVLGMLLASLVLTLLFLFVESRAAEPLMPLSLFQNRVFAIDSALSALIGMAILAVAVYMPLFMQAVLHYSPANSGAAITPLMLSFVGGAVLCGRIMGKIGRFKPIAIAAGAILTVGGILLTRMSPETSVTTAVINMIVTGIGIGMFFPILTLVAQNVLPRNQLGVGTSTVTFFRSIGSVVGIAIVGTIVGHSLATQLGHKVPARAASLPAEQLGNAIVTGFQAVVALGILVFILALIIENVPITGRGDPKAAPSSLE